MEGLGRDPDSGPPRPIAIGAIAIFPIAIFPTPNRDFPFENRDWLFLVAIGLFSFVWTILVQIALVVEVGLLPFSPAVPKACRGIRWVGV